MLKQFPTLAAPNAGSVCTFIFDLTGSEILATWSEVLARPIKVVLILIAAWVIKRFVHRAIDRSVASWLASRAESAKRFGADDGETSRRESAWRSARKLAEQHERGAQRATTLGAVMRSIASIVIYSIATMMSLGEFDVNLGPLIAGAGVVGVAVGFGAQSLVKDFLSGIFMLIEDQYGVGDVIDVGDTAGVVEEVKLRTTQIRDVSGTLWHVPNGAIARVANMSQEWARAVLDVDVAYDTDLGLAMTVIKGAADAVWQDNLAITRPCSRNPRSGVCRTLARTPFRSDWSSRPSRANNGRRDARFGVDSRSRLTKRGSRYRFPSAPSGCTRRQRQARRPQRRLLQHRRLTLPSSLRRQPPREKSARLDGVARDLMGRV